MTDPRTPNPPESPDLTIPTTDPAPADDELVEVVLPGGAVGRVRRDQLVAADGAPYRPDVPERAPTGPYADGNMGADIAPDPADAPVPPRTPSAPVQPATPADAVNGEHEHEQRFAATPDAVNGPFSPIRPVLRAQVRDALSLLGVNTAEVTEVTLDARVLRVTRKKIDSDDWDYSVAPILNEDRA